MAGRRNLTLQLDESVIRKARILAAERSTSVSRLVAEEIERLVGEEEAYRTAEREALATMQRGLHLGGGRYPSREELHER